MNKEEHERYRFNTLNQVYVFNTTCSAVFIEDEDGFNPLNQVYVFNKTFKRWLSPAGLSFNPLNQVYVFNRENLPIIYDWGRSYVLIP